MASHSARKKFSDLSFPSELMFYLNSACSIDEKDLNYHEQETILNCFNILNYIVLEQETCLSLLSERYTDMMIKFVKQKQFYSLPAIKMIHTFSCIPFTGMNWVSIIFRSTFE